MESCLKKIKDTRNVTDSTLKVYKRNMNKIAKYVTKEEFKDISFIKNKYKTLLKFLNTLSESTRRVYLSTLLVFISKSKGNYYNKYADIADELNDELLDLQIKAEEIAIQQQKTEYEEENWATMAELNKVRLGYKKELDKSTNKNNKTMQKYMAASFFLLMAPRRTSDIAFLQLIPISIYNRMTNVQKRNNYLVLDNNYKFFSFGKFKTVKRFGVQAIPVSEPLNEVIDYYLKYNKNHGYIFLNSRKKPYTASGFSMFINRVFAPSGKHISCSLMRKIYLSEKFTPQLALRLETAYNMGHSSLTASQHYIKK